MVGGNKIVDFSVLIEIHLRVPGTRAKSPHHNRRAAFLPLQQFGNRINRINREADNGAARRQARDLFRPGVGQLAHALAAHEFYPRNQRGNRPPHGLRAQKQSLMCAAHPQQTVREHMPPLGIGAKLDLVHGNQIRAHAFWHGLHRADPILRARWHDTLFASHQRHDGRTARRDDLVIDLTRQQTQRQADHTCAIAQHPLDGVMGLACVGRA